MDIWVRSQDSWRLVCTKEFTMTGVGNSPVKILDDKGELLGEYKNVARGLEVLYEIHDHIEALIEFERVCQLGNEEYIRNIPKKHVYCMPEE